MQGLLHQNTWSLWSGMLAMVDNDTSGIVGFIAFIVFSLHTVAPTALFACLLALQCLPRARTADSAWLRTAEFISTVCLPEVRRPSATRTLA